MFSLDTIGEPIITLLASAVTTTCLIAYTSVVGGVYKLLWINFFETTFVLNSALLSAATLYQINAGVAITPITYTSTGTAFVFFMAIVLYHLIQKILQSSKGQTLLNLLKKNVVSFNLKLSNKETKSATKELALKNKVTYSVIELDDLEPLVYN